MQPLPSGYHGVKLEIAEIRTKNVLPKRFIHIPSLLSHFNIFSTFSPPQVVFHDVWCEAHPALFPWQISLVENPNMMTGNLWPRQLEKVPHSHRFLETNQFKMLFYVENAVFMSHFGVQDQYFAEGQGLEPITFVSLARSLHPLLLFVPCKQMCNKCGEDPITSHEKERELSQGGLLKQDSGPNV